MRSDLFIALALTACSVPAEKVDGDAGAPIDGGGPTPGTTITAGPPALDNATSATFRFESSVAGSRFQCLLDDGDFESCKTPQTYGGLSYGPHTFRVRAIDPAGVADPNPAMATWTIDTPPVTTIIEGPPSTNQLGMVTFQFTATGDIDHYECNLDGVGFVPCSSPYKTWIGNDIDHAMSVRAWDRNGNVEMNPPTWFWHNALANPVFVSNDTTYTTALGGLSGADAICAADARAGGLVGTYRAWLSTSTVNAIDRLSGARGWVRVDGKPFVDTTAELAAGQIDYPVELDQYGQPAPNGGALEVLTGTTGSGSFDSAGDSCGDWTATSGRAAVGWSDGGTGRWTSNADSYSSCGATQVHLYCFGVDDDEVLVSSVPQGQRAAFVTSSTWTPGGGLVSADQACQNEAKAAGLGGTFLALLGSSTMVATARFTSTGPPWARRDGIPIAPAAATLFDPQLEQLDAPIDVTAAGVYLDDQSPSGFVWTTPLTTGTQYVCDDWTSSSASSWGSSGRLGVTGIVYDFGGALTHCDQAGHLYCLQQ